MDQTGLGWVLRHLGQLAIETELATSHLLGLDTSYAVWAGSGAGVFAIGGTIVAPGHQIRSYDGADWRKTLSSSHGLSAVWGSSARDVYAVGADSTIRHWDGVAWQD